MTEAKLIDYIIILAIPALLMYARKNKNNIKLNLIAFAIMVVYFHMSLHGLMIMTLLL